MRRRVSRWFPALLVSLAGCGDGSNATPSTPAVSSVGRGLEVPQDGSVATAVYTLSGPNGFASVGTVPVGNDSDVTIDLGQLPAGAGYELDLSYTQADGATYCSGQTLFDVAEAAVTISVIVHLDCAVPTGNVALGATFNTCPVLDGLSASPNALLLGGIASLVVTAHDADDGPSPLSYSWTVNGVRLPRQTGATLRYGCTSAGTIAIVATVSDGDPDPACAASASAQVTCQ